MVGLARSLSGLRALCVVALIVSDVSMLRLAFVLAYRMRLVGDTHPGTPSDPPSTYDDLALLCVLVLMVILAVRRLYIPRREVGRDVDLFPLVAAVGRCGWSAMVEVLY